MNSYTEEIAYEYYKHLTENGHTKYVVASRVPYRDEKGLGGKKVKGWQDIDVLAIGNNEICIIQTKSFSGYLTPSEFIKKIKMHFETATAFVMQQHYYHSKPIQKILVLDYISKKSIATDLEKFGIKTIMLEDMVKEFIEDFKQRRKITSAKGKEESMFTRTILLLLEKKMLK